MLLSPIVLSLLPNDDSDMAVAKFKPGAKISVEPNLPKLAPKEYKSPVRDEKVVPVNKLVAYVSGTEWSTNYYSQLAICIL